MDPITGFLINLIIGALLSAASTLAQQAFAQKPETVTGSKTATQIGGKVPQYFLMGTVGDGGKLENRATWGEAGGVPNAYCTDVISYGDLPISAMTGLYVNGVRVTLSDAVIAGAGFEVPEYAGNMWRYFLDGTQTSANAFLLERLGPDPDRPWLADMIGRGVPYLISTRLWSDELWQGYPKIVGEFQGIKLYDVTKDSTAGGDGSHRWDNPATWEFSDNNAVMIYNILRGIRYQGQHIWGGRKTAAELPYAVWAAAINACNEWVPLNTNPVTYERRFRAGRRVNLNERPADVIRDLLVGCNGRVSHSADGTVYILIGVPSVADGAFSGGGFNGDGGDVLATEPLGSIPFPNLDEIINGTTATYREPAQAWDDKETAPYYRSDLEAEDDGRRQTEGVDLGTTFSGTQAQRILKAVVEEARRFRRHVVALPPEFAVYRPLQVLAWTTSRFDYSAKLFLITARTIDPWGNVVLALQEIDPSDHDWEPSTDEKPITVAPSVIARPTPQPVSGFYVEPAVVLDSSGLPRRPAIDAFWSAASVTVDVRAVRITVRLEADESLVWEGEVPRPELGSARLTEGLLPNEDYEVQIQYMPHSGRVTLASSWLPVTTPDVRLGSADVVYGDIDLDELGSQIEGYFAWIGATPRQLIEQLQAQDLAGADQELANAVQMDEMRRSLSTSIGEVKASFDEVITVAIVPLQQGYAALADQMTILQADIGDVAAAVTVRGTAQASPGGGWARWGVEVKVDSGSGWSPAAFFIDTNGTTSRAVFSVNQFVITDGTNVEAPFIFENGEAKMMAARIGTIRSGRLLSFDGKMDIDLDNKRIRIVM